MRKTKLISGILFKVCMIIILFWAIVGFVPRIFGVCPYVVLSGSMEPEITTGSIVYVDQRVDADMLHINDVITYEMGDGTPVTHRIVDETAFSVITKGDNNDGIDFAPVPRERILGKAVYSIPGLGYLYDSFHKPPVLMVIGAVVMLDLIISCTTKTEKKKEIKEEKIENEKQV